MNIQSSRPSRILLFALAVGVSSAIVAAAPPAKKGPKTPSETIEMFSGMKSGEIDVQIIPKDEFEARVLIKNKTKKPLTVQLPETFAASPVLAQRGGGGANRGGGGGNNNTSQNQTTGGGMGGMGGMGGGGGGMFNVAPEQTGQFKVATVCLEHGKKIPRAAVPYEILPLEMANARPEVKELLAAFGRDEGMSQKSTQAAAWFLANDVSWDELANKKIEHLGGTPDEPWFKPQELAAALKMAQTAKALAEKNRPKSPGDDEPPVATVSMAR